MENKNQPAFQQIVPKYLDKDKDIYFGLTKREYFAIMAMQGLLAFGEDRGFADEKINIAKRSIELVDELLKQLG